MGGRSIIESVAIWGELSGLLVRWVRFKRREREENTRRDHRTLLENSLRLSACIFSAISLRSCLSRTTFPLDENLLHVVAPYLCNLNEEPCTIMIITIIITHMQ
jgi:hypothetical protein